MCNTQLEVTTLLHCNVIQMCLAKGEALAMGSISHSLSGDSTAVDLLGEIFQLKESITGDAMLMTWGDTHKYTVFQSSTNNSSRIKIRALIVSCSDFKVL